MYVSLFLSPFREQTVYRPCVRHFAFVGVKVCQLYNVSGERFYYKHEALILNQPRHPFSLKDIQEVKAMIKRDLDRENLTKRFAKGKLGGPQSRNFAKGGGLGGGLPGTPVKPVRRQDGFDLPRFQESKFSVAGPSRVNYVGPPMDESARKKRTCKCPCRLVSHTMRAPYAERSQTVTCTRKSRSAVKVSNIAP